MVKLDAGRLFSEIQRMSRDEADRLPEFVKRGLAAREASDVLEDIAHDSSLTDRERAFQIDEAIEESFDSIFNVQRFSDQSLLYEALDAFAGSHDQALSKMRSAVEADGSVYFVTGAGYDTVDKDLLGGNGSGEVRKAFEAAVSVDAEPLEVRRSADEVAHDVVMGFLTHDSSSEEESAADPVSPDFGSFGMDSPVDGFGTSGLTR